MEKNSQRDFYKFLFLQQTARFLTGAMSDSTLLLLKALATDRISLVPFQQNSSVHLGMSIITDDRNFYYKMSNERHSIHVCGKDLAILSWDREEPAVLGYPVVSCCQSLTFNIPEGWDLETTPDSPVGRVRSSLFLSHLLCLSLLLRLPLFSLSLLLTYSLLSFLLSPLFSY